MTLIAVSMVDSRSTPGEHARQAADAAAQGDAADHHGGEHLEQHADAEIGRGAVGAGGEQEAGEGGDHAGEDEDAVEHAVDIDAGAERRGRVAADQDRPSARTGSASERRRRAT